VVQRDERTTGGGGPGANADESAFADALVELTGEPCNLLVVGAVPRHATVTACRRLFGDPSADRYRLLVYTHDGDVDVGDRLGAGPMGPSPGTASVVRHLIPSRSVEAVADPHPVETCVESGRLSELGRTVSDRILEFTRSTDDRSSREIRVCFDSLSAILAEYDTEPVFRFVNMMVGQIHDVGGVGLFHLPYPRDSEVVALLEPLFDGLVELRVVDGQIQQRWHLADRAVTSDWQPLEDTQKTTDG